MRSLVPAMKTYLMNVSTSSLIASTKGKCKFPSEAEADRITSGMRYFGLFTSQEAPIRDHNLLDSLCGQLEKLLSFQPGERDLVMLQYKFVVEWSDGKKVGVAPQICKAIWLIKNRTPLPLPLNYLEIRRVIQQCRNQSELLAVLQLSCCWTVTLLSIPLVSLSHTSRRYVTPLEYC